MNQSMNLYLSRSPKPCLKSIPKSTEMYYSAQHDSSTELDWFKYIAPFPPARVWWFRECTALSLHKEPSLKPFLKAGKRLMKGIHSLDKIVIYSVLFYLCFGKDGPCSHGFVYTVQICPPRSLFSDGRGFGSSSSSSFSSSDSLCSLRERILQSGPGHREWKEILSKIDFL